MPSKPLKPCAKQGCPALTSRRYCDEHMKQERDRYDRGRKDDPGRQWMQSARWRKATTLFKAEHPLCEECRRHNRVTAAYLVDHIVPHEGNYELFWDQSNWEPKCNPCHEVKHGKERWKK
jgi:5-methylcytosine-specific restriction protein A